MSDLGPWNPLQPREVSALLAGVNAWWWLSGGWSLDLLIGSETRIHADTDVTILRPELFTIREHLSGWDLHVADPRGTGSFRAWHKDSDLDENLHDVWCRPSATEPWCLQLMINDVEGDQWVYRRHRRIRRPLETLTGRASSEAMPALAPEIQLLYKSKDLRDKDQADFLRVLPCLEHEERAWLLDSLILTDPHHPWIGDLRRVECDRRESSNDSQPVASARSTDKSDPRPLPPPPSLGTSRKND